MLTTPFLPYGGGRLRQPHRRSGWPRDPAVGVEPVRDVHVPHSHNHIARLTAVAWSFHNFAHPSVRDKTQAPYQTIAVRTRQLERLEVAMHLFRQLLRYLQLVKRLHGHLDGGDAEMANAAGDLHELGALCAAKTTDTARRHRALTCRP